METTPESTSIPTVSVQLNDLHSYLSTFNKEIETTGEPGFSMETHSVNADNVTMGVSPSEEEKQDIFLLDDGNVEASVLKPQKDVSSDETSITAGKDDEPVLDIEATSIQSLSQLDSSSDIQTIAASGLTSDGELIQIHVPSTSVDGSLGSDKIVFLNEQSPIQLVESEVGQLTVNHGAGGSAGIMGQMVQSTDGTSVLTAVTDNPQFQTIQVDPIEWNGAQLVAVRNSQDSSQPQLVAVQNGSDQSGQQLQILKSEPNNQDILNGDNNYQTVAIMPSDQVNNSQSGEMNYVLIVSNQDGGKEDDVMMSTDPDNAEMKDEQWEVVQDLIQEDGSVKRLIRYIPPNTDSSGARTLLACRYCNYTSPKKYLLMRHLKCHSIDKPHKCNICERSFKTYASLQNHHNTHTGIRPHRCKECTSCFTTSGELVRHIRYKHTFEKPHKCTECDYASVELSKLKRHMRSHTGERPYQCPHCNYASPDTYKLKRHLRIHTGEKPYECDICKARFTQSNSLKAHKLIHSGNKPVFQCDLCPTTCGRRTDLKIHMQKLHSSEKLLQCKKCMQEFPDRYSYKLHVKTHEGEKCFQCEHCDYAAYSTRLLENHVLTHTGEKPFICDVCGATFRQKQLLKRHRSLYHMPDDEPVEPRIKRSKASMESMGNPLTAEQLLQGSLLNDMKEGRLGDAPKVVIVHPDGRVEEVTGRLQTLAQQQGLEEVMMKMTQDVEHSEEAAQTLNPAVVNVNKKTEQTFTVTSSGLEVNSQENNQESRNEGSQVSLETDSEHSTEGVKEDQDLTQEHTNNESIQLDLATMENGRVVPVSFQI